MALEDACDSELTITKIFHRHELLQSFRPLVVLTSIFHRHELL